MSNILLVYASTTGNTEVMAEAIADYLIVHGQEVVIKSFDFDRIDVEMIADYDAVLVGTHTWDDGDLPYEVEDFYEDLGDVDRSEEHKSELQSLGHIVNVVMLSLHDDLPISRK